ncbi:hypothetical protein HMPREF3187_01177, partial [Aerococcus christensenii]
KAVKSSFLIIFDVVLHLMGVDFPSMLLNLFSMHNKTTFLL